MGSSRRPWLSSIALLVLSAAPSRLPAQAEATAGAAIEGTGERPRTDPDPSRLLPPGTLLAFELFDGAKTFQALLSALGPLPEDLPPEVKILPAFFDLAVRSATGLGPAELLATIAPAEAVLAFVDGEPRPFWVLRSRVQDREAVRDLIARLEGQLAARLEDGVLTVTVRHPDLRALARRPGLRHGRPASSRPRLPAGLGLRLHADLAALRKRFMVTGKSLWSRLDGGSRFLVGPIQQAFSSAHRLDGVLRFAPRALRFEGTLDASARAKELPSALLVRGGTRSLPSRPPGTLAVLSLDRSLSGLFGHLDEVLEPDDALQAKSFLSIADKLVGRGSFVHDLLGKLGSPLTLFVLARIPRPDEAQPRIALPSFVLLAELDDRRAARMLENAASLTSLINAQQRRMTRRAPFALRVRNVSGSRLLVARLSDWNGPGAPPIEYGLSPTLLLGAGHAILSSTEDGALGVLHALEEGSQQLISGDFLSLSGAEIADALRRNRDVIALTNLLEQGIRFARARKTLVIFESLAGAVRDLSVRIVPGLKRTKITLRARRAKP